MKAKYIQSMGSHTNTKSESKVKGEAGIFTLWDPIQCLHYISLYFDI